MWIRILWCLWYYLVSVSEYWNRYSAFFCPVWCFLCSWFHFQTSDMCGFTLSFFRFIFFPFPLYHHFSFITAEFQCRFKLSSCLILILFLWFLIFPDDGLHLFFFLHIPVKHFLPLDSSWFLHGGNIYRTSPYLQCSLTFLILCRESFTHLFSHFHGTEDRRVIKGDKRSRESCSHWTSSRNVVNGMISILSLEFFHLCCFFPQWIFFFTYVLYTIVHKHYS